jgi:hypothetical protein
MTSSADPILAMTGSFTEKGLISDSGCGSLRQKLNAIYLLEGVSFFWFCPLRQKTTA